MSLEILEKFLKELEERINLENNYFIIKISFTNNLKDPRKIKFNYFLATKSEETKEFLFWKNVQVVGKVAFNYDSSKKLEIFNDNGKRVALIPPEKYYNITDEDLKEKFGGREEVFLELPLNPALYIKNFKRKNIDIKFVSLEAELQPESIEKIFNINKLAINYDSNKLFSEYNKKISEKVINEKLEKDLTTNELEKNKPLYFKIETWDPTIVEAFDSKKKEKKAGRIANRYILIKTKWEIKLSFLIVKNYIYLF